jgi:hypothetical protein
MTTIAEAIQRRADDMASMTQALARTLGGNTPSAEAIVRASLNVQSLTDCTEGDRLDAICEVFRRYGIE